MTDTYDVTVAAKPTILKDPQAILDYTFDWTAWLDDVVDTISAVAVPVITGDDASLVMTTQTNTTKKAVIWLSGGTVGKTYKVDCKITTASVPPRSDSRSIYIKVKDR